MFRRRSLLLLFLLIALAACLRFYRLDWQSSNGDENFSLAAAGESFPAMMRVLIADAVHPPLHYLALWLWLKLFGFGQLQSRLLSVLFGLLSVPVLFLLVRRLLPTRTALLSAALLGVSQIAVHHSQDGRMYPMAFFFGLCAVYFFLRALQQPRRLDWILFLVSSVLMLYTNYYSFTLLLACALCLLIHRPRPALPTSWILTAPLVFALALLPWLAISIQAFFNRGDLAKPDLPVQFGLTRPISSLNWFNNGQWDGMYQGCPWWSYPAGFLLFTLPALLALAPPSLRIPFLRDVPQSPECRRFLLLLWLTPMLAVSLICWTTGSQYNVRYVVYALAGYLPLVALGLDRLSLPAPRTAATLAAIAYSLASLYAVYFIPFKSDYRGAAHSVVARFQPGDCLCFMPFDHAFRPGFWTVHGRPIRDAPLISHQQLQGAGHSCARVWLIWDHVWFRRRPGREPDRLMNGYLARNELLERGKFFGLDVGLYRRR